MPPSSDARPDVIEGRFVLGEFVGRGAFAEVFRAIDQSTGRAVAVKRLRAEVLEPTAAARFELEAQLIARVASPHVVGLVAMAHDAQGRACMVLEWLEGEDLARRQARDPVPWALGVDLSRQAALGLGALHAAGIVHRDVKPSNFLLVERGAGAPPKLVVIDLGVARMGLEPTLTLDGLRLGTPAYMSPEQARGEREVGPRADIYALGVVLYELLSGVRPFRATDPYALLAKIVLQAPVPLRVLVPELPEAIEQVVMRALAKAPEHRFASAEDFAWALAATPAAALMRATPATPSRDEHPSARTVASSELPTEAHGSSATSAVLSTTGGEQRVVTALFAGFAPGAASAGLEALGALVVAHEGTLDKTLGGRAIAVFGLVRSRGDEALRAARVALRAREQIPGARLSITTCRVLATSGSGPSGEAIERGAGGVESAAGIRLDAATARLLEERFEVGERAGQTVLLGERAGASEAVGPTLFGRPTPTVGRDRELGTLDALRAECASEPVARAVLVTGAPGVGKSRVRHEFVRRVRAAGEAHDVWLARGDAISAGAPFALIAQAVRRAVGLTGSEPVEAQRERLLTRARERVAKSADPERVAVFLGEIIRAPWPDETANVQLRAARQIPQLMGDQIRRAWDDWVGACLALGPIVLLIEDLHWGDAASVRLIDAALATHAERALMVVAFARPEVATVFPGVWSQRGIQEIRLGELTRKASERLVREALGERATDALVARVVEASGGNAFFLEELIRASAEGTAGALPDTIFAMLQSRLDALDEDDRRILRTASVFGRAFWRGGVRALLGAEAIESDAVLDARLEALGARELVTRRDEARLPGETEYTFRHALLRDAAYATWSDADRAVAHRLAGEWLERSGETNAAVLGEHFERGGLGARAAEQYVRAARDALEGNDFEGTISLAERAIARGVAGDARIEARLYEAEASRWNGRHEPAAEAARDAWERSPRGSANWFRAFAELVMAAGRMGRHEHLDAMLDELERVVPEPGAESALAHALMRAVLQALYAGRYERADKLIERADALEAHPLALEPAARGRLHELRAMRALFGGDGDRFLERIPAALALFDEVGDYRTACIMRGNYGYALREVGDYDAAIAALEETVATAARFGLKLVLAPAKENLGSTLWRVGRTDEAVALLTEAAEMLGPSGDTLTLGGTWSALAEARLSRGDAADAVRASDVALGLLAEHPPVRALALAVRARGRLAGGDDAGALDDAREAFGLLEKLGDVAGGESTVCLALVEAQVRAGDRDGARATARVAYTRVTERAAKIRDPARRASYLRRVPENLALLALVDALDARPAA